MTQISDKFDELKIYGGNSYSVNDVISIRQPTLKEIREYGEKIFPYGSQPVLCGR